MNINFGSNRFLSWLIALLVGIPATLLATSCSLINEPEEDCELTYLVEFQFTNNIMEVDAFASKVPSVTLFVFDKSGNLVTSKSEHGDALKREHYKMSIDVEPGTYDLVAWCGLKDNEHFTLAGTRAPMHLLDHTVSLIREHDPQVGAVSEKQLKPLFHAIQRDVVFPDNSELWGETIVAVMDLIKDTNTIRVILTHYNGEPIDPDDFSFAITDNNGTMNYDNTLLDDEIITYREWTKRDMPTVDDDLAPEGTEITSVNTMIAEIDVARLLTTQNTRLTIRAKDREDNVLSLPITQLLLHAKGEAKRAMPDQEYLDRQDEYNMMFFLTGDESWYTDLGIYINGWHMRMQTSDL